jgi:hypothetical protein
MAAPSPPIDPHLRARTCIAGHRRRGAQDLLRQRLVRECGPTRCFLHLARFRFALVRKGPQIIRRVAGRRSGTPRLIARIPQICQLVARVVPRETQRHIPEDARRQQHSQRIQATRSRIQPYRNSRCDLLPSVISK